MRLAYVAGAALLAGGLALTVRPVLAEDPPALAPYADVEVSDASDGQHTLIKITVADLGAKRFHDLHLRARAPGATANTPGVEPRKLLPPAKDFIDVTNSRGRLVGKAKLTYGKGDGALHALVAPPLPDGQYYLDVRWSNPDDSATPTCHLVSTVTSNGAVTHDEDDEIGDPVPPVHPKVPGLAIAVTDADGRPPVTCARGTTTRLTIEVKGGVRGGCRYRVFTSRTTNSSYDDRWGVGIDSETNPIPAGWKISIAGIDGVLNASGVPALPVRVTVPDDPALQGRTFFVVVALMNKGGDEAWMSSLAVEVTIP